MADPAPTRDPYAWVMTGQRVEARYGNHGPDRDGVHATGTVVAYLAEPSVVIRTDSGERLHWAVSLVEPVNNPCGEPTDGLVHQAYCTKPADHYGERHTADLGVGHFTWGYLAHPSEETEHA